MRRSKFSESQRLAILAEQDGGKSVEEICRKHQIPIVEISKKVFTAIVENKVEGWSKNLPS